MTRWKGRTVRAGLHLSPGLPPGVGCGEDWGVGGLVVGGDWVVGATGVWGSLGL